MLASLHTDLNVVGQHQDDLAEGVAYLGSALKGFASIAYGGDQEVNWANIYVNATGLTSTYGVIGPCGTLDQVLDEVLGPDPLPCDEQTGPLPGSGSNADSTGTLPSSGATTSGTSDSPNSGIGALSELLSPLLGTKK